MQDDGKSAPGEPIAIGKKPSGNLLGFSLEFREGTALVSLQDRKFKDRVRVERLSLEVPDVSFPFDVSGGAEQFCHHRCRLRTVVVSAHQDDLTSILAERLDPARYGLEEIRVRIGEGQGLIRGRWRVGESRHPFVARFLAEAGTDLSLRLGFFDIRVFGFISLPVHTLVAQLGRALKSYRSELLDVSFLVFQPVRDLVRWLLPSHGWKIPDLEGMRIDRVEMEEGRIRVISARYPDELAEAAGKTTTTSRSRSLLERQYLIFKEGAEAYRSAELALHEGRLEDARKLYLGKAGVEPAHPHAARRMLEIGTVRPERFDEIDDLIRDLLEKDADFLPALLARAVLEEHRGDQGAGRTYEQIGRLCADRDEREDAVVAHLKAGGLLQKSDPEKAVFNYERVLELDPDHLGAMHILTGLYEDQKLWYRALRMNLKLAHRLDEPDGTAACHLRMGKIFLERFDDLDRARKHFDAALTHDPQNLQALAAQAAVQQQRDQPTRAAKLLNRLIELAEPARDEQLLLEARLSLARLWEEDLEDPESALLHYQRVLDSHPDHLHSLFKVGSLAALRERWDQASAAFSRLLELESSGQPLPADILKAACLAMGRIYMSRPDGRREARSFLMRAASLEKDDLSVLLELEKINREEGAWADLVDVLEHKSGLLEDPQEVLAATLDAARLADRQMGDQKRAEQLYSKALGLQPSSDEAIEGLSVLLRNGKRYSELADLLVSAASEEPDPRVAASFWAQVGEIRSKHLDDMEGSNQALELAVDLDPSNRSNAERLLALYREREQYGKVVELIARLEEDNWEGEELVTLWLERAQVLHEKLDDKPKAIESYQQALDIDPDQLQAHRALADLYVETRDWQRARETILTVFDRAGEGGLSGPGRTELHRKLAAVELALGNREEAIDQYRAVLTRFEDDAESARNLGQLLREDEKWEDLAAFYAGRAERKEGKEAAALHTAAASIWWEKLARLEPAATQYQAAVDAAPQSEAVGARLASLQRVYAGLGAWQQVTEVLRRRISLADAGQKAPMLLALAAILGSRLDDAEAATRCWEQALQSDPDCRPALLLLARRRFEDERFEEALELGERAISPDLPGPQLPAEILAKVALEAARAAWALEKLDDAARLYSAHVDAFAPRHFAGVDPEAFERLELLLRKQQRYEDLALVYQRWLTAGTSPEREGGVRRALGLLLFEHVDRPDEAVDVLTEHIQSHPEDQSAVSDLLDMLRKSARWERLAHLLEEHWQKAPQEKDKIRRLEELADVYQMRLHQPDSAIAKWQDLMDLGHEPATDRLAGIYRQEGQFEQLVQLLRTQAEEARDRNEALRAFTELGQVARDELQDRQLALEAFREVYSIEPSAGNQNAVLELLREMGDAEALGEFLGESVQEEESPERQKQLLLEKAELCIAKLGQPEEGLALLRQVIEIEPEESLVNRAQTLYEQLGDWEGVADMQEALVDLAEDQSTAARRVHRLGRLFLNNLDAPERAAAAFERAAELQPGWLTPLTDQAKVLEQVGDFRRLLELKLRICEVIEGADEQSEQLHAASGLAFDRLEDAQQGVELLERAVATATDPTPLLKELADRCESLGMLKKAADALEHMVSESGEIAEAAETPASLLRRIADLRRRAGEEEAAVATYELVLQQEPSDADSAVQLESIYRSQKRFSDLAMMFESLAGRKPERQAADVWLKAAKAWLDASEAQSAEAALQKALAIRPDHDEANLLILRLIAEREAWPELLNQLEGLPDEAFGQEDVRIAAGAGFAGVLEDPEDASQELRACRMMLRVDPDHTHALQRSAQLLQEGGEAQEAEAVLRRLDTLADRLEDDDRYRLDIQLAEIDFSRGRTDEAEVRLKRCIEAQPEDPKPRAFLHKLYTGGRRFADRVELLLQEAEQAGSQPERFGHLRSAAELLEEELGDPEGAAGIYRQIVEAKPDHHAAWQKLSELYRLLDNPEGQREALLKLAELLEGEEQIAPMRKAARLAHDVLEDHPAARQGWTALLARLPDDSEALDRLLALDRLEKAFEDLDVHLDKKASRTEDPAALAALLRERATVLKDELERCEDAVAVLERLRELQPRDAEVLRQLAELYLQLDQWPQLAVILQEQVELAGSERERAQLWSRLAGIREEALGDRAGAIGALRKAIALDPEDGAPLLALRRLAVDDRDDVLLVEALEALAARATDETKECDLRRSVGLLKWSLGQKDEAKRAFTRALALDENDLVSRRFVAEILFEEDPVACTPHIRWLLEHPDMLTPGDLRKLKRMLVDTQKSADAATRIEAIESLLETVPDDLEAARQLSELYQETGNQKALAEILARMSELEADEGKAKLWIRRAEILAREGEQAGAVEAFSRALQLPGDHRYQVALRLARMQLHEIKDESAAAITLEEARKDRPEDPTVLQMLSDIYWSLGRWEQAESATQQLIGLPEGASKPGLLLRLGDIHLREGNLQPARQAFERTISLDPAYREAYQRLEEVLKAQQDDKDLAEFYLAWATSPAAGSRRIGLYSAAARHLQRIDAVAEAIGALRQALKLDPSNVEVYEILAPLLAREGEWEGLMELLAHRRELADDPERKLALTFEMGEVCKEHLQDLSRAAARFEECLAIDPEHTGALEELADIRYLEKNWDQAGDLYRRLGERGLGSRKFVVAFRRGEIAEHQSDLDAAIEHYRRSTELNDTFIPSRQNLIRLLGQAERWEESVEAVESLLEVVPEEGFEDVVLDLWRRLGHAQRKLLRFDDAARSFEQVLKRKPDDIQAVRVLYGYHKNRREWKPALVHAKRALELEPDSPDAMKNWMEVGDMYLKRLEDFDQAEEAYREALRLDFDALEPRWRLWELFRSLGNWEALQEVGAELVNFELSAQQKIQVHRELGRSFVKSKNPKGALANFEQVLKLGGADLGLVEEVAELARGEKKWGLHASLSGQALEARLKQGLDPEEALERYLKLAGVYQEHIKDISRAAACIRRALELHPRDKELLRRLGTLYASDWETYREAIEVFRELAGMDPTDPELYRYLARLESARGEMDRTACYYTGLRFLAPMDQEARRYLSYVGAASRPNRPLGRGEWDETFLHPAADCLLQRIMSVMAPYLEQLFPADFGKFGIQGDQMVTKDNFPEVAMAAETARWLVASRPFSVFIVPQKTYEAWLESGGTASVLISREVLDRSNPAELAFFIAREVVKAAMGFILPSKLSPNDLVQLLALLCKLARPEAAPPHSLPPNATQYLAAIQRVTPQQTMEMVVPLIRRYSLEPRAHDVNRWAIGVERTADRVGLLVCGDLNASMSVITRFSEAAGGRDLGFIPDRASLLNRDERMLALFRFAFSEQFLQVRKKLGVVVSGPSPNRAQE